MPAALLDEPRAAVPAGVQERAREAVVVAHDEHRFPTHIDMHELSALRHLFSVPCANPPMLEKVGTFPLKHRWVGERRSGELRGLLQRHQGALDFRCIQAEERDS